MWPSKIHGLETQSPEAHDHISKSRPLKSVVFEYKYLPKACVSEYSVSDDGTVLGGCGSLGHVAMDMSIGFKGCTCYGSCLSSLLSGPPI